jgi:fumarylacetoacetate (FAA) hydrolase
VRVATFLDPHGDPRVGRLDGDRLVELRAPTMLAWLAGEGHADAPRDHALADVRLLAPVPRPPSFRDFYAYEEHVRTGNRLRGRDVPEAWYGAPAFYFSNPASIRGPGAPVRAPQGCRQLEVAGVVGEDGALAGFTILNDWSARDVQRAEMTVGLGPAKGKDFATSLGPFLVTPDELDLTDGRLQGDAELLVDGEVLSRTPLEAMHWSWPQLLAHAARDTVLHPGDVLGSGTLGRGCLLELNAGRPEDERRWLQPGQDVVLRVPGLGELATPVV